MLSAKFGWNFLRGSGGEDENIFHEFSLFWHYLPLEKGVALRLNRFYTPPPMNALCQVWWTLFHWYQRRNLFESLNEQRHSNKPARPRHWHYLITAIGFVPVFDPTLSLLCVCSSHWPCLPFPSSWHQLASLCELSSWSSSCLANFVLVLI